ncbi:hypothetical protein PAECIP111893_00036 [Paenibacillus plantiphilus]|uniref:Uncharacterized protein n=1 Tax=Paenibacillus plantiphilus TaxID=2905650 RepID=A0ABN8FV10_9BACL|nr:hypothetical protein PAECIP111893_00036 [Paenibacillus plantiphilus]
MISELIIYILLIAWPILIFFMLYKDTLCSDKFCAINKFVAGYISDEFTYQAVPTIFHIRIYQN